MIIRTDLDKSEVINRIRDSVYTTDKYSHMSFKVAATELTKTNIQGGITMALVEYKLKNKDNLTEEEIKAVEAGRKKSVVFDDDSPEITPEMMKRAYRPGRAKSTKKMVSMYMEEADIEYFKSMSKDTGIPYQTLISMYLTDCRKTKRKFNPVWEEPA